MADPRPDAADCACRAFLEALREGINEYQAIIVRHFAGKRFQRTGRARSERAGRPV